VVLWSVLRRLLHVVDRDGIDHHSARNELKPELILKRLEDGRICHLRTVLFRVGDNRS
jgi:hypothetical protein